MWFDSFVNCCEQSHELSSPGYIHALLYSKEIGFHGISQICSRFKLSVGSRLDRLMSLDIMLQLCTVILHRFSYMFSMYHLLYISVHFRCRSVQYVHCVMHKCIMVKVRGKRRTKKVCKKTRKFAENREEILKSRGARIILLK